MNSEILVTVSGAVGSGKSALCKEIEILCRALGVPCEWDGGQQERNLSGGDSHDELAMYKPTVTIRERVHHAAQQAPMLADFHPTSEGNHCYEPELIEAAGRAVALLQTMTNMGRVSGDTLPDLMAALLKAKATPPATSQPEAAAGVVGLIAHKGMDDFAAHVCPAESAAVWNACCMEHHRLAQGLSVLSSTKLTSTAVNAVSAKENQ